MRQSSLTVTMAAVRDNAVSIDADNDELIINDNINGAGPSFQPRSRELYTIWEDEE